MITNKTLSLVLCASLVALVLSGCEKEGPAERTGEKIDKAVEQAGEAMKKAGDKMQETTK